MSIEFRCTQCGTFLRVGDESAGKQARCPSCRTVQNIPFQLAPAGRSTLPAGGGPFGPTANTAYALPVDPTNPYASPTALAQPAPAYASGKRSGPPWERDGASWDSFWDTARSVYSSPSFFFGEMRRKGGLAVPLLYALVGAMIGSGAGICYKVAFRLVTMQLGANPRGMLGRPMSAATLVVIGFIAWLIVVPILVLIQSFIGSGVFHLCLELIGGARRDYETTFRVVSYSIGSAALLGLLPICGGYVQSILVLVFTGIGLAYCHDTTGGKATLAVLLPILVCCGAFVAFYAAILGVAILR